ncbi:cytochrome monooxygenase aflU [Penicillium sp. IBT 35674x]|nr:cytochrome monooxygenase aflU [Penicillium sp. IBT 35674x]
MANLLTVGVGGILISLVTRLIYRVYFHPLSKIPGPKLAAATSAYIFYFNVIKQGTFIWQLERLHEVYGPIVRVSPREVHIKDSNYYDDIYASSLRRREKDLITVRQFDIEGSAFSSVSPEDHRERRAPFEKFFSRSAIAKMEETIQSSLDQLCEHLTSACKTCKVVNLDAGFAGMTADIIHKYTLGYNSGNLDNEDFNENVRDGVNALFRGAHLLFFLPFLQTFFSSLPLSVLRWVNPSAYILANQKMDVHSHVVDALAGKRTENGSIMESLASNGLAQHLRGATRLTNEAFSILIGGTETTGRSLSLGFFNILSDSTVRAKLREELRSVMPTPQARPTWNQLEQLPYLSGVILETLRLSTGIANRSPRVAPTETLIYKGHTIPPGTLISQTNYFVLMDPEIFPDPHTFDPDRWARAAAKGEPLQRYLVNFSKGSRICLGMHLAYAEIYLAFATLIRQFEFELYDTTEKNITFTRDFGTPYPDEGNFSLKVLVKTLVQE